MCFSCIDGLVAMCLRNRSRSSIPWMHRQHFSDIVNWSCIQHLFSRRIQCEIALMCQGMTFTDTSCFVYALML